MESEKVKDIKKALECCTNPVYCEKECPYHIYERHLECINELSKDALMLINELESENERLNEALVDNLEAYKDGFKEGAGLKRGVDNKLKTENLQLKERIADLEKENGEQYKRIMELEQDLVHADEKVFYRECNVTLRENEIKEQALKPFAERLKAKTRVIVDFYADHADKCFNGISEKGIDETLKEFLK